MREGETVVRIVYGSQGNSLGGRIAIAKAPEFSNASPPQSVYHLERNDFKQ